MAEIIFWICFALIVFAYVGYSVLMVLLGAVIHRRIKRDNVEPTITFLITAYNEELDIAAKLEQTLSLDYPSDKLDILVASDGSTDRTDEIVAGFVDRGVRLLRVEGRVGKTATQNEAVRHATGEIIVFSDATTQYETSALRKIVRNYADPSVGAVSGRYEYRDSAGGSTGLGTILFWKYENLVKSMQTRVHTITGCCGCIYSVRRSLYVPLPADIISDLVQPLKILEQGHRIVFEKEAVAYEEATENADEEFTMRVRVITRGMRGILYMKSLLNPFRHPLVAFQLFGHKVARWFVPVFAAGMLVSSAFLLDVVIYQVAFALMVLGLLAVAIGAIADKAGRCPRVLRIPLYLGIVNLASLVAMWGVFAGRKAATWETVRRPQK